MARLGEFPDNKARHRVTSLPRTIPAVRAICSPFLSAELDRTAQGNTSGRRTAAARPAVKPATSLTAATTAKEKREGESEEAVSITGSDVLVNRGERTGPTTLTEVADFDVAPASGENTATIAPPGVATRDKDYAGLLARSAPIQTQLEEHRKGGCRKGGCRCTLLTSRVVRRFRLVADGDTCLMRDAEEDRMSPADLYQFCLRKGCFLPCLRWYGRTSFFENSVCPHQAARRHFRPFF